MEFGNIGNYYIIEPFIRELHKTFPNANIRTTIQMTDRFQEDEGIDVLPMELYYGWNESDLEIALSELGSAYVYAKTGVLPKESAYIKEVLEADLVIDFSGDIWGDNAGFLGSDRLLIGLIKDRVPQLLGKKTVMLAGSPGPFKEQGIKRFAKEVYENFDLVTNREPVSIGLMKDDGFNVTKTKNLACPAFLFEPAIGDEIEDLLEREGFKTDRLKVGFIVCGWNFIEGPFDKEHRDDSEYIQFAEAVEFISEELGGDVYLMSHSNGFHVAPENFKLIHGRDYQEAKRLQQIIKKRGIAKNVYSLDGVYDTWQTKAILGGFDMLVSGRVHAAVAGLSQNVPTVIIDYGHEPKAHKLIGFAKVARVQEYVADPCLCGDLIEKITTCFTNREEYKLHLDKHIPEVHSLARKNFELLESVMDA